MFITRTRKKTVYRQESGRRIKILKIHGLVGSGVAAERVPVYVDVVESTEVRHASDSFEDVFNCTFPYFFIFQPVLSKFRCQCKACARNS